MSAHQGGCLCGALRYETIGEPSVVFFCHCKFCQRSTGGAYLVEPIFDRDKFKIICGNPDTYEHRSEGSGKRVTINFCATCGTKLFLDLERFSDVSGVFGGTYDDPNWFKRTADNSKHIFLEVAQHGTLIPSGVDTFLQQVIDIEGEPVKPIVFESPHSISSTEPT